jgi:REP element-mobilizing transposase RayT
MRYRRADVTGGTYFFTVNLAERSRRLLVDYVDGLRTVMQEVKAKHPFRIDAMVILPDHLHALGCCQWMIVITLEVRTARQSGHDRRWLLPDYLHEGQIP